MALAADYFKAVVLLLVLFVAADCLIDCLLFLSVFVFIIIIFFVFGPDPTLVVLTSNFFVLCTNTKVDLYNYS